MARREPPPQPSSRSTGTPVTVKQPRTEVERDDLRYHDACGGCVPSYRDPVGLMAEWGVRVTHTTIMRQGP